MTSNLSRWRFYFKDAPCPDTWIDLGWYFCVAAALQRRVWYGRLDHRPLFTNMYLIFIGPPATGKNLVISPVNQMLKYWPFNPDDLGKPEMAGQQIKRLIEPGPDTVTFQKLVERLAKATRRVEYKNGDGKSRIYSHASMCLTLTELNSLFTRHSEQIPKMMLKTYDCEDYEYDTKHQGHDLVRNTCVNLLAGTTPAILKEAERFYIFDDGFVSRTLFVFETKPRHSKFHIGELSDEQIGAFDLLALHIKKLTSSFGQLTYSKEVYAFLEDWAQTTFAKEFAQAGPKMATYYGRKKVLILKLAAAITFSEEITYEIPLSSFQRAIDILTPIERNMEIGFSVVGKNHLHPVAKEIQQYLKSRLQGDSMAGLLARFSSELTLEELQSVVNTLVMSETVHWKDGKLHAN